MPLGSPPYSAYVGQFGPKAAERPAFSWSFGSGTPSQLGFTRASNGQYRDASGSWNVAATDVARFDHKADGTPRGLLLEGSRTNNFFNSNAPSTQVRVLGTGTYTLWVDGSGSCQVAASSATGTGFGTATAGSPVTFTITAGGTVGFTVTGSLDWCQCENGTFPSSRILTGGATATRAADVALISDLASIGYTGADVSVYAEFELEGTVTGQQQRLLEFDDGTSNNLFGFTAYAANNGNQARGVCVGSGSVLFDLPVGATATGSVYKMAGRFASDDYASILNGNTITTDTSGTLPTVDRLYLGNAVASNRELFGWLRKLTIWNRAMTDSELETLVA